MTDNKRRDYFAAKAMQGFITYIGFEEKYEAIAWHAYKMADAMIKESEKRDGER